MKSVFKRAAATLFALVLTVSAMTAGSGVEKAYASFTDTNKDYAQYDRDKVVQADSTLVLIKGPDRLSVEAGGSYDITQIFILKDGTMNYMQPVFIGSSPDDLVSFSDMELEPFEQPFISSTLNLRYNMAVKVTYKISVSKLAKVGRVQYGIAAYDSRVSGYDDNRNPTYASTGNFIITLDVLSSCSEPMFVLDGNPRVTGKAGEYLNIPVEMTNKGDLKAYDVYVSLGGNSCLMSSGTAMRQKVDSSANGDSIKANFRFLVDAEAKSDTFNLPITVTCRDYTGATYQDSSYYMIVNIQGKEEFTRASSFVVKNVKQSPEKPRGGENVTLTFDLENNGDSDFRNVKVLLGNVSSSGFEPIDSNPYTLIGDLGARETRKMELTYKCGSSIGGGTNALTLNFAAEDKHGAGIDGNTTVYVLNVIPSKNGGDGTTVSKPKLMVTNFTTDKEEILAADKFEFKFNIKNTNDESVARNIKVKVTSQSFSVTAGSNTFFISDILPGEEAEIAINLKASSSLQTGAYAINVEMEYEYDVEVKNGETNNAVTANDEILLQVNELLRAQCENVQVGDWDTPVVGMPCPLTFEFYNMGRSPLSNVYVTVEGDFELATGNSHYIGNIGPGSPEFVECSVRPLISGDAELRFIIHMEDSNGDEVTRENSTMVYIADGSNGGGGMDIGIIDFPGMNPGMDPGIDPGVAGEGGKKLSPAVIGGIVAGVVVVAAVIVITVVKRKKKKNNEDEFDD